MITQAEYAVRIKRAKDGPRDTVYGEDRYREVRKRTLPVFFTKFFVVFFFKMFT